MIKTLTAALLLLTLAACNSNGVASGAQPATKASTGRTLPVAPPPPQVQEEAASCIADVKQCADGSFVGRDAANNCAFKPCSGEGKQ